MHTSLSHETRLSEEIITSEEDLDFALKDKENIVWSLPPARGFLYSRARNKPTWTRFRSLWPKHSHCLSRSFSSQPIRLGHLAGSKSFMRFAHKYLMHSFISGFLHALRLTQACLFVLFHAIQTSLEYPAYVISEL
ncbi:hypothetical protein Tco_0777933 [Tanacetum coccineum]